MTLLFDRDTLSSVVLFLCACVAGWRFAEGNYGGAAYWLFLDGMMVLVVLGYEL